jgi:outer membrane protein assembly factor BamB
MNLYLIVLAYLILSACVSFGQRSREFTLNNVWVATPFSESNTGFRRLNRSSPVQLKLEKKELLVYGNPYNGIMAVDKKTGQPAWTYRLNHGTEAKLSIEGSFVFVAANDGFVYALDGENGQPIWSYPTRSENLAELLVSQGRVYILSSQNTLHVVEALSGKRVWIYTRPDSSVFSIRGGGRPAIYKDRIFVGFGDGALVSFKATTGQVLWEREFAITKKFRDLDSDIQVIHDSILVGGFDDAVYLIDQETGTTKWKSEGGMFGSFAVFGKMVCFCATEQKIKCLDINEGTFVSEFPIKEGIATSPVFYKNYLVFGESEGALQIWDVQSKKKVASFYSGRGLLATPLVDSVNDTIYFVSNESYLYAMEAKWNFVHY